MVIYPLVVARSLGIQDDSDDWALDASARTTASWLLSGRIQGDVPVPEDDVELLAVSSIT